jgi:mannose-6-phosphate isomerase-like protein (cupin superfamily)
MKKFWGSVAAAAILLLASGGAAAPPPAGTQRVDQFENDDVHVWKAIITPNAPLTMHRHEHPRVLVALDGGNVNIIQQAGGSELNRWETGKAYWLPASKPGTMHTDSVVGRKPIEVMVVELKKAN